MHPIEHVDIPAADNTIGVYAGAKVRRAPHPQAAANWRKFIRSLKAIAIFRRYGFKRYQVSTD